MQKIMLTSLLIQSLKFMGLVYCAMMILVMFFANQLMFPSVRPSYTQQPPFFKIPYQPGEEISMIYVRPKNPIATVLLSHGNGEDLGRIAWLLNQFFQHQIAVLAYDYPGYGHSDGRPTEASTYQAITAAYNWLRVHEQIAAKDIFIYGYSIGSGPSIELASHHPDLGGLVIDSGFVSAFRVITRWTLFPLDHFKNLEKIKNISIPSLFIHGRKDRIVPFWHGKLLFSNSSSSTKQFLALPDGNHRNRIQAGGKLYWDTLTQFLTQHRQPSSQPILPQPDGGKHSENN